MLYLIKNTTRRTAYVSNDLYTNDYGEYRRKPIPYGTSLSGITTAEAVEDSAYTGFLGFGVAITGPS